MTSHDSPGPPERPPGYPLVLPLGTPRDSPRRKNTTFEFQEVNNLPVRRRRSVARGRRRPRGHLGFTVHVTTY